MSALGRNDAFSVVGGAPNARIIEGHVSRVSGTGVFVVSPTFDAGLEFGPVQYSQVTPPVGAECIVAIMTGTTEAWLLSWSGPHAGSHLTPTAKSANYTAVSGDLVLMSGSFIVTLPSPALSGQVVGVRAADARTGAAPVTITTPSGLILGLGIGVNNVGAASAVLGIQNAYMLLESDGTNWHVIAGEQDTGHIAFPFAAGEGNLSGHVASYRKRGDYVTLRGMTHFTSGVAPWPIGTLPVGFRPLNSHYVLTHGSTAAGNGQNAQMLAIEATGAITLDNIAALNGWSGNFANLAPLAFHAVG